MQPLEIMGKIEDFINELEQSRTNAQDYTTRWLLEDMRHSVINARVSYSTGFMKDEEILSIIRFKLGIYKVIIQPAN